MPEFDVKGYYTQAQSGFPLDPAPLLDHIRSYRRVILWGASLLGQAVQRCLKDRGIPVTEFWDLRHQELEVEGTVTAPYASGDPSDTLIVLCVGNTIIQPEMARDLAEKGYASLMGDRIFQGLGCPLSNATGVDADACLRGCCRAIYCQRLSSIVQHRCAPRKAPPLFLHSVTIVVNQICSLSCQYCTSYMNEYPPQDRINFPAEQVIQEIRTFFEAIDGVGTITIMGGEPFLHPQISEITQAILDCGNFGVISIATSGTARIRPSQLASLRDRRVNVSFSNYLSALSEKQQALFHTNVAFLEQEKIPHAVGLPGPYWIIPSRLDDKHLTREQLMEKKRVCVVPLRTMQLKNGAIYPCDFCNSIHGLKVADYPDSYIQVPDDPALLRQRIIDFEDQPCFSVCGHCQGFQGNTSMAGEQGYVNLRGI